MIVPFVMTMLTTADKPYLWSFYTLMNLANKQKKVMIAQEEYFTAPSVFVKQGRKEVCDENFMKRSGYSKPTDKEVDELDKYPVPKSLEEELIKEKGCHNAAQIFFLSQRWEKFEQLIDKYINEIESKHGEKIEAFMTLCHYPSLSAVAEKHGIKVIHFELGALRDPAYLKTVYFDFHNLYGDSSAERRYNEFGKSAAKKVPLLDKRTILALMYKDNFMKYLTVLDKKPEYKMGVALGYATWPMFQVNTWMNDEELLYQVSKYYKPEEFITRKHPADPASAQYMKYDYSKDIESANTVEFVLRCERVVSLASNVSFEAMLYGRTAYTMTYYGPYFNSKHDLSDTALSETSDEYVSFYVLGYLVQFEYALDLDYIKWRLSEPNEKDIYLKHLEYYLNIYGLNLTDANKSLYEKLISARKFDANKKYTFGNSRKPALSVRDCQIQIEKLKAELEKKNERIAALLQSDSTIGG